MSCECNKISLRAFFLVFLAVNVYVLTCRIMKSTNIETLSTLSRGACKLLVIHTHHRRQRWHVFIQDIHVRIYTWGYVIANYNHEDYIGSEIKKSSEDFVFNHAFSIQGRTQSKNIQKISQGASFTRKCSSYLCAYVGETNVNVRAHNNHFQNRRVTKIGATRVFRALMLHTYSLLVLAVKLFKHRTEL